MCTMGNNGPRLIVIIPLSLLVVCPKAVKVLIGPNEKVADISSRTRNATHSRGLRFLPTHHLLLLLICKQTLMTWLFALVPESCSRHAQR